MLGCLRDITEDVWLDQGKPGGNWMLLPGAGPDSSGLRGCGWSVCFVLRAECYNSRWGREMISVRWEHTRSQPLFLPQKH